MRKQTVVPLMSRILLPIFTGYKESIYSKTGEQNLCQQVE